MTVFDRRQVQRGSWGWALKVAELTAWSTAGLLLLTLVVAGLPGDVLRQALVLTGGLCLWLLVLFRVLLPRSREERWAAALAFAGSLAIALALFGLLRAHLPSMQLLIVPVIVISGLLSRPLEGIVAALLSAIGYWVVATFAGGAPRLGTGLLNSALFLLSGAIAGVLSDELRSHYRGEQEEHRLANAVRHRLLAVLDAVDEAVVFRDRQGNVRIVNRRAGNLFSVAPDDFLGQPVSELLRTIARRTEDPEGFMETFQELRDSPDAELRVEIEQIMPERRQLRLYSGPTFDDAGVLVGRIDVYTDITDSVRRAAEVERLYEEARATAESYQRALLPKRVPTLPRTSVVARYIPAAGRRAVCGDFYDFVTLSDGHTGMVVGDVCGIGPGAANDAAMARYTLRSLAEEESDTGDLLARMNEIVYAHMGQERFLRLLLGSLDPERALFRYANAGHVPPVVYRAATGLVEWLVEGGVALGVEHRSEYKVGHTELEPGDMLVMYTDGITEASRRGQPFGQGKFSDIVADYGVGTPGEMVQAIGRAVDAWVGEGELRDDLSVVVAQITPDALMGGAEREVVLPNEAARMSEMRAFVRGFLTDVRASVDAAADILLAVGEATANAVRHGRRQAGRSEVRVRCRLAGDTVTVTIADDGPGFDPQVAWGEELPDRFASGGRGLFLMRQFVDQVEIEASPVGTRVWLSKKVL